MGIRVKESKIINGAIVSSVKFMDNNKIFLLMNNAVPLLMALFLLLIPFTQHTAIREICIYSSILFALILTLTKKTDFSFRSPLTLGFVMFLLWALLGLPFALNKPNSIHDIYAHLLKYMAVYYLLVNFFCSRKRLLILTWVMIVSGTIYCIWYVSYFYLYLGNDISKRMTFFPYRDYIYVFSFLLAFNHLLKQKKWLMRVIPLICLFSTLTATLLSQTRNALLAIVLGLCVYCFKYKKAAILILLTIVIAILFTLGSMQRFDFNRLMDNERIAINLTTIEIVKDYPIFGIGFGMQTYGYKEYIDLRSYLMKISKKYQHHGIIASPHNLLADTCVRTGFIGLGLFLFIMICYVRMGFGLIKKPEDNFIKDWGLCFLACFAGFFTQSMFGDAAFGLQAIVLYTILAMMTILWRIEPGVPDQTSLFS